MKIYIATSLENIGKHHELRDSIPCTLTYDWTTHGSLQDRPDFWSDAADKEIRGVVDADIVVVLIPGGKGTHTELGAALATHKRVLLWAGKPEDLNEERWGKPHTCVFYHHPLVEQHFGSEGWNQVISKLESGPFSQELKALPLVEEK